MKKYLFFVLSALLFLSLLSSCGKTPDKTAERQQTWVSGTITVDPEIDDTGDFSGIRLLAAIQDTQGNPRDTVFHAITDSLGNFSGNATFAQRDIYPVLISRGGRDLGVINVIFAEGDSVQIEMQLPEAERTTTILSRENNAYMVYERLQRNFNRVAMFINAGQMEQDEIEEELKKWSDMYWQLFNQEQGTLASRAAGSSALTLLQGWNNELMLERLEQMIAAEPEIPGAVRRMATGYHIGQGGLDSGLEFLDRLYNNHVSENYRMSIKMDKIELLYDSARSAEANELLDEFKERFSQNETAMQWAENAQYDLMFLSPGQPFPDFEFVTTDGEILSGSSLENTPYLIEITRLEDPLYQEQYDRTTAIYQIYNTFGLQIITIPVDATTSKLNAFFDERVKLWSVVEPGSFDEDELFETYNINRLPARFLVNDRGEIVRRYIGPEFDEIVRGLQLILTEQETEE